METIKVSFLNNSNVKIHCPDDVRMELSETFSFYIENAKHHPLVKARRWDGKIRLYNSAKSTLPVGLVPELSKFVTDRGYNISIDKEVVECFSNPIVSKDMFTSALKNIPLSSGGNVINAYDYQLKMAYYAIKHKRQVFLSATSTGKSASIYLINRLLQELTTDKLLIIVPSVSLVEQLYGDFKDYSELDDEWIVEHNVEKLYSEYSYTGKTQILISTWQSLLPIYKAKDFEFFEQFKSVVVDECHLAKGDSLQKLVNACTQAEYKIGLTGTLDGSLTNEMVIKSSLGPVVKIQSIKQATESGRVSPLKIECIELKYPTDTKSYTKSLDYQAETSFLNGFEKRNNFILNLVKNLKGNTLVLFNRIEEHGDVLNELLTSELPDRSIFYIHGGVEGSERNDIRSIVEKEDNAIVLASSGTMSTGVSVKRIHNIIFSSSSKSIVRILQSIGRGLRLASDKEECTVYDLFDNFEQSKPNFSLSHAQHRFSIYAEQEMNFRIRSINL
jgi:superfamily II DNA or RNA helicase